MLRIHLIVLTVCTSFCAAFRAADEICTEGAEITKVIALGTEYSDHERKFYIVDDNCEAYYVVFNDRTRNHLEAYSRPLKDPESEMMMFQSIRVRSPSAAYIFDDIPGAYFAPFVVVDRHTVPKMSKVEIHPTTIRASHLVDAYKNTKIFHHLWLYFEDKTSEIAYSWSDSGQGAAVALSVSVYNDRNTVSSVLAGSLEEFSSFRDIMPHYVLPYNETHVFFVYNDFKYALVGNFSRGDDFHDWREVSHKIHDISEKLEDNPQFYKFEPPITGLYYNRTHDEHRKHFQRFILFDVNFKPYFVRAVLSNVNNLELLVKRMHRKFDSTFWMERIKETRHDMPSPYAFSSDSIYHFWSISHINSTHWMNITEDELRTIASAKKIEKLPVSRVADNQIYWGSDASQDLMHEKPFNLLSLFYLDHNEAHKKEAYSYYDKPEGTDKISNVYRFDHATNATHLLMNKTHFTELSFVPSYLLYFGDVGTGDKTIGLANINGRLKWNLGLKERQLNLSVEHMYSREKIRIIECKPKPTTTPAPTTTRPPTTTSATPTGAQTTLSTEAQGTTNSPSTSPANAALSYICMSHVICHIFMILACERGQW